MSFINSLRYISKKAEEEIIDKKLGEKLLMKTIFQNEIPQITEDLIKAAEKNQNFIFYHFKIKNEQIESLLTVIDEWINENKREWSYFFYLYRKTFRCLY